MNEDFGVAWLTVPEVCERLGIEAGKVRRLIQDGELVGAKRGERSIFQIPEPFLADADGPAGDDGTATQVPLQPLKGTLVLLRDSKYSDDEAIRWLLTENDELGKTPVESLREGMKHAVRRAAQSLAF